ncbi:beta/gamma crystallin-related protein [Sphingopyxis sp. NJF-3]
MTGIGVVAALSATAIAADKLAPIGTGEATIYRDTGHAGPALYVNKAQPNLKLSWPVRSIRVRSGTWELCARTNYRSPCIRVAADEPDISGRLGRLSMMQSMRPLGVQPEVPAPPAGTSLRGMSAEFFPAPGRDGLRILSCAGGGSAASCAARTADEFCRSAGWNGSKSESQQTLDGRVYLADVFCVRSGY